MFFSKLLELLQLDFFDTRLIPYKEKMSFEESCVRAHKRIIFIGHIYKKLLVEIYQENCDFNWALTS